VASTVSRRIYIYIHPCSEPIVADPLSTPEYGFREILGTLAEEPKDNDLYLPHSRCDEAVLLVAITTLVSATLMLSVRSIVTVQ